MLSNMSLSEVLDKQNAIIHIQADIIDSLFVLLMQYMDIEDIEQLACMDDMQEVVTLYQEIDLE